MKIREEYRQLLRRRLIENQPRPPAPIIDQFHSVLQAELENRSKGLFENSYEEYKAKGQFAQEVIDACNEIIHLFKEKYASELRLRKKPDVPAWRQQSKISKALGKTAFEDVWNYIWQHTLPLKEALRLAEEKNFGRYQRTLESGAKKGEIVECSPVLFIPDYLDMTNELGLSKISIQKYLNEFSRIGIIRKMGKAGPRGRAVCPY